MPDIHRLAGLTPSFTAEEEAYSHIIQRIRMGQYKAGDRLIPEEIAAEIGTSRMPVREAFRRLSTEGLVDIRPHRGAVVRKLSSAEMEEVFHMRAVLEGLAARIAFGAIQEKHIAVLEDLIRQMELAEGDVQEWVSVHRQFHEYLCSLSHRPRLVQQISSLHSVVEPHMRLWLENSTRTNRSRSAHGYLIDALRSGSAEEFEKVIRQHVEGTIASLGKFMTPGTK
jgi:DNA-binding GntR family transcriptional regulator